MEPSGTLIDGPELDYLLLVATFNMTLCIYYWKVLLSNRLISFVSARLNRCSDQYRVSAY